MIRIWCVLFLLLSISNMIKAQKISEEGMEFIKEQEGCSLTIYWDGNKKAIGYGHNIKGEELLAVLRIGDALSKEWVEEIFKEDVKKLINPNLKKIFKEEKEFPQNVYDVFGSLIYNIGYEGLINTKFYKLFKKERYMQAFLELPWTKIKYNGNIKRRYSEVFLLSENFDFEKNRYVLDTSTIGESIGTSLSDRTKLIQK
jgi:GH24 family phage-related lysozyme (muramidase)